MLHGHQTWVFNNQPTIIATAVVGGPFEAKGPLANDFDLLHSDIWLEEESFEKAQTRLLEDACDKVFQKSGLQKQDIQFFLAGDLLNQIISSSFAARTMATPFLGLYGACSSSMESLALSSLIVNSGAANHVLCGTVSHNSAVEKQFRYPNEYGSQKPPTAQWTVTAAGVALLAAQGEGPKVTSATIGKIVDMGISDPYNMGGAMAPAAVDTIIAHFQDMRIDPREYDLIVTGDLGRVGYEIAADLLKKHNLDIPAEIFTDCGIMIYGPDQQAEVMAGGSGCGCSAAVTYGHLLNRMKRGELRKILIVATGALLSPLSYQQKESIPCIAHAVSIESIQ